ncbi:4-hydroxy-2-oxovalerate aldolase, partial [Alphaproteobacteria bacterium]|nr:4-hydroxy-2-oxovalerate aldolase [Alphaproteobacteria bacterium]
SYGHPGILDHKDVINACEKIINCCNKYKKSCGTQITDVSKSNINKQIDFGYNFIILSSDLFVLWKWSESLNKTIQEIK